MWTSTLDHERSCPGMCDMRVARDVASRRHERVRLCGCVIILAVTVRPEVGGILCHVMKRGSFLVRGQSRIAP
jgi:hypothetical protein